MDRREVSSSMICSIGFDFENSVVEIEFKSGAIWNYYDFPASEWHQFDSAESHGKYFLSNIKGKYREIQVG